MHMSAGRQPGTAGLEHVRQQRCVEENALGQDAVPEILKELNDLAQRQFKIFEVTNNIARGKNK